MTKMIDYADNVFFITEQTKLIEKGLALALTPALFAKRFLEDAEFISNSLIYIRKKIDNSPHTLKRPDNLRSLMLANQYFAQVLPSLMERGYLEVETGNKMCGFHKAQALELEKHLINIHESSGEAEQVSSQEFKYLLKVQGE